MQEEQRSSDWRQRPSYHAVVEGGDLDCGSGLLLLIRRAMAPLGTGEVLEVRSRERSVAGDLPAWCRMVGHEWVGAWTAPQGYTYYQIRKMAPTQALPTSLDEDIQAIQGYRWTVRLHSQGAGPAEVFARNHKWKAGAVVDFGPTTQAPTAIELFLSALAAEQVQGLVQAAAQRGLVIDEMECVAVAKVANVLAVLAGAESTRPYLDAVSVTIYAASPEPQDVLQQLWSAVRERAPLLCTLERGGPALQVEWRWQQT